MTKRAIVLLMAISVVPLTAFLSAETDDRGSGGDADEPTTRPAVRRGPSLSDEQEAELLEVLREHQPGHYRQLTELRDSDPRRYRSALMSAWRWYQRWKVLPEEVQEASNAARNARITVFRIMRELRDTADPQARRQLLRELREAVRQEFQAEQIVREYRLEQLEAELERLREELKHHRENAEELIEERVERYVEVSARRAGRSDGDDEPGGRQRDRGDSDE